ncbi:unnamed protein product (macronuclear) [Paramecium tetraurelia]|uniref:non-specific serine/threonine protein kinase n=1 Tax=Paramecium tetraurelia TaxID=5888 RepID=A0BK33_PARTE|nr:uncharacterized protein GSPATT00029530001 [Paramecium tetraurelia]CAK58900.1 unnamed protein product [Paramecium tetraurelia]|eukprot:XP_001426298.1 hypothetical protein (macronuclear) [Paramecium tetraurelia strain d4-2]
MPTTINDFIIIDKLGEGSFSQVYKVKRIADNQFYALKKVNLSLQTQNEKLSTLNEIRILASINNQHIIEYKDSFLDSDGCILYIVMEYAPIGNLIKLQQQNLITTQEIWRIAVQLLLGLKCLHDNQILHRDLKLANILVVNSPIGYQYKIGDLNISKIAKGNMAKTVIGTPLYAAPEVWQGTAYSYPCDIWSLGCLLYELAKGAPPFNGKDLQDLNLKIQSGQFDPINNQDLNQFISFMLKVKPKDRLNCDKLLQSSLLIKNSGNLAVQTIVDGKIQIDLLQTIQIPKNLKQLNLPSQNYIAKPKRSESCQKLKTQNSIQTKNNTNQISQLPPKKSGQTEIQQPPPLAPNRIARPILQNQATAHRHNPLQITSQRDPRQITRQGSAGPLSRR